MSQPIKVDGIIFNPKSPAPGDTIRVTAVVTPVGSGGSLPGDFVDYEWSATGGSFIGGNKTSVEWVSPSVSQDYVISVTASNSVSNASMSDRIFVGSLTTVVASGAGEMHLAAGSDPLYYVSTTVPPGEPGFSNLTVRRRQGAVDEDVSTDVLSRGFQFAFAPDLSNSAHVFIPGGSNPRMQIVMMDLTTGDLTTVARDQTVTPRPDQFATPAFSMDSKYIAYTANLTAPIPPSQNGIDTFTVYAYTIADSTHSRGTFTLDKNGPKSAFYPSISTDGTKLVFVANYDGEDIWDVYSLPFFDGQVTPDTIVGALQQLTQTGGIITSGSPVPSSPPREWNSVYSVLAILDGEGGLWLVPSDGGANQVPVAERVRSFKWSWDGEQLAVTAAQKLYVLDRNGGIIATHESVSGDILSTPSWSPDRNIVVYSNTRGGGMWYEAFDVGGVTNLTKPIAVTASRSPGSVGNYSPFMSVHPVFGDSGYTVFVLFFDAVSARASFVDLSGLVP